MREGRIVRCRQHDQPHECGQGRGQDRPHDRPHDRGQAWPLLLFVVAVVTVGIVGLAQFGQQLVHAARARAAADAAALAGTTGGRAAAARMAAANGAVLVSFITRGETVVVEVAVHDAHATAAATDAP